MATRTAESPRNGRRRSSHPRVARPGAEVQAFDALREVRIGLPATARAESTELLNGVLADSTILYALYKKHHWLVAGPTFYSLHLLFDKHAEEQRNLIDLLAERVQTLGGIAVGDPRHVAELASIERAPDGAEDVPGMLARLLRAHDNVIERARAAIEATEASKDYASNDLLMSDVLRTNELQMWFLASHLVEEPLVRS